MARHPTFAKGFNSACKAAIISAHKSGHCSVPERGRGHSAHEKFLPTGAHPQGLNHFSHPTHKTDDVLKNGLFVSPTFLPSGPGL